MNKIYTCIGIGDLLIYASTLIEVNRQSYTCLMLNNKLLATYRNNSKDYQLFINQLLDQLKIQCEWTDLPNTTTTPQLMTQYKIKDITISKNYICQHFNLQKSILCEYPKYLLFHTKCRSFFDYEGIKTFCKDFKTTLPIVIIGERQTSNNKENQILHVECLYNIFNTQLRSNNQIIDLSVGDIQNHPSLPTFEKDLAIIHNAESNLIFGQGGNLVMSCYFAKHFIACIGQLKPSQSHPIFTCCPHGVFCENIEQVTKHMNQLQSD